MSVSRLTAYSYLVCRSMGTMPPTAPKGASAVCQNILGADNEKTKQQQAATTTSAKR